MPKVPYQLLLSDPPWAQSKGGKKKKRVKSSGLPLSYPTLSLPEIENHHLLMLDRCSKNLVVFLWTIEKFLPETEMMLKRLGIKLHARMIWNKILGIPAAFTIRYGHEYLLYGYRGKLRPVALQEQGKIHSVFTEKSTRHSQKPEVAYQIIERLYPDLLKIEMYARRNRVGWDSWGNEVPNDVEIL